MNLNSESDITPFNRGQKLGIFKIASLISAIREIDGEMPLGQLMFFITVAQNEGKSLKEIANLCKLLIPSASRYMASLMFISGGRLKDGVSLIHAYDNPVDRRQKIITLTPAGKKLVEDLIQGI